MADRIITEEIAADLSESLEEAQAEIKGLLRDLDCDDYVSQEGWADCFERIESHLNIVKRRVQRL